MKVALALARDALPGASVDLDALVPTSADAATLVAGVDRAVFAGTLTEQTRRVIAEQVQDVADPAAARALVVGLALGGPEFQRR
jgi:hypothetical protein